MAQPYCLMLCCGALVAVLLVSRAYGRFIGMFAAATCGVSVAWVMPPSFSFQVDGFLDQFALAAYGAFSLLVVIRKSARPAKNSPSERFPGPCESPRTSLGELIPPTEGVEVFVAPLTIASDREHARRELEAAFRLALAHRDVENISVYGGRWPGVDRVWVAARYRSLPEEPCVLMSAPNTRNSATICSFDNGYERIYQISLPTVPTASKPESPSFPA